MAARPDRPGAQAFLPSGGDLPALHSAAENCRGCELYADATQVVFGQGPSHARLVLIGEQPGDIEDQRGLPFVGPAGKLLRRALHSAELDADQVYFTNAVKHFRWKSTAGSQRRIHEKPGQAHVTACRPWLISELSAVRPKVVVALGATAAQSIMGTKFALTHSRGSELEWPDQYGQFADSSLFATIHPSAVLRAPDDSRQEAMDGLVADLSLARQALQA
jgi:uracil-DNA glycosylase family protein